MLFHMLEYWNGVNHYSNVNSQHVSKQNITLNMIMNVCTNHHSIAYRTTTERTSYQRSIQMLLVP